MMVSFIVHLCLEITLMNNPSKNKTGLTAIVLRHIAKQYWLEEGISRLEASSDGLDRVMAFTLKSQLVEYELKRLLSFIQREQESEVKRGERRVIFDLPLGLVFGELKRVGDSRIASVIGVVERTNFISIRNAFIHKLFLDFNLDEKSIASQSVKGLRICSRILSEIEKFHLD